MCVLYPTLLCVCVCVVYPTLLSVCVCPLPHAAVCVCVCRLPHGAECVCVLYPSRVMREETRWTDGWDGSGTRVRIVSITAGSVVVQTEVSPHHDTVANRNIS